jgi:hypothetical protein
MVEELCGECVFDMLIFNLLPLKIIYGKMILKYYSPLSNHKIENEVTMSSSLLPVIVLVLLVLVILIVFLFRKPSPVAAGVPGVDITGDPNSPLRKWDCSRDGRQIIFSDVPAKYTPYLLPFNKDALEAQPKEGFEVLISIAADVRFRNSDSKEIDKFKSSVNLWMSYNAQDLEELRNNKYTIDDLVPVKIIPGATNWKPFSGKIDYSKMKPGENGEFGGVSITVDSWGDPPMGWGSPKGT